MLASFMPASCVLHACLPFPCSAKYRSAAPRAAAPKEAKATSYWDRVDWNMPTPSFVPNKWYYQVAWAVVFAVLVVYANMYAARG